MLSKIQAKLNRRYHVRRTRVQILGPDPRHCQHLTLRLYKIGYPAVRKQLYFA